MVSKPADCIFPYDFKDAVKKKVKFYFLLLFFECFYVTPSEY